MLSELTYSRIAADVTSNCNLRCPFCVNDWRGISGNTNMSEETFSKLMELIPLAAPELFFLSCAFEPTIHPDLVRLLRRIPSSGRKKVCFTTNLARPLSRETFQAWSESNIHHINVSVESLEPSTYEELRRGAKFSVFMNNLEDLVSVFRKTPTAPRIRYISVVFKQNLNQMQSLASVCRQNYLAEVHEVRMPFTYSFACSDGEWMRRCMVSEKEWDELVKAFSGLPVRANLINESEVHGLGNPSKAFKILKSPSKVLKIPNYLLFHFPDLGIRVLSDGTLTHDTEEVSLYSLGGPKNRPVYNINDLQNPRMFLKRTLYRAYNPATWPRWRYALWRYLQTSVGLLSSDRLSK